MEAAGLRPFEFVHVNNLSNAAHWETYVIPGDTGQIILNGPPARLFQPSDKVVILGFSYLVEIELENFVHVDVMVNDKNEITEVVKS
jgi:aspartate 1-decarboxylase